MANNEKREYISPPAGMGDLPFSNAVAVGNTLLTRAGFSMQDIVSMTIFCPDLSLYDVFNKVYRNFLRPPFPARAFIGSGPLLFGAHFEIQAIAVKGGD